jgi:hypothetical protein
LFSVCNYKIQVAIRDRMSDLSCPRARQLYRIQRLHPPARSVTDADLRDKGQEAFLTLENRTDGPGILDPWRWDR